MLNIKDIQERLKRNPEPKEVGEMREKILAAFNKLEFIEEGHIYNLHNDDGTVLNAIPSVSSVIHRYEPENDWDLVSSNYALKHDMDVEVVRRTWRENNLKATNSGSLIHLYGEYLQKLVTTGDEKCICEVLKPQYENGYLVPNGPKQEAIMNFWEDIFKVDDIYPLLPECKMYMPLDNKYGINEIFCGTGDITFAYKFKDEWCILLYDYKTNASLTNSYNTNNGITMLEPFDELIDEARSHYTLQLSLYSMMLENLGFKVIDRKLIWLKNDTTYEKVRLPYIKEHLIKSFNIKRLAAIPLQPKGRSFLAEII